jgi:hypothetical protein
MSLQTERLAHLLGAVVASFAPDGKVSIRDFDADERIVVGDLGSPDLTFTISEHGTVFTFRTSPVPTTANSDPKDRAMGAALEGLEFEWNTNLLNQYKEHGVRWAIDFLAEHSPERLRIVQESGDPDGIDY